MGETRRTFLEWVGAVTAGPPLLWTAVGNGEDVEDMRQKGQEAVSEGAEAAVGEFAKQLCETDGAPADVYESVLGEDVPPENVVTNFFTENQPQYVEPNHPLVKEYAAALDLDSITGTDGSLDFGDRKLPEYASDRKRYGRHKTVSSSAFLKNGGDCEDYSNALTAIMDRCGLDARSLWGAVQDPSGKYMLHTLTEFQKDGERYLTGTMDKDRFHTHEHYVDNVVKDWQPVVMWGAEMEYQIYETPK